MKIGTLFAGGGGVDIGAKQAGATLKWAIENDSRIAAVYRRNVGNHIIVSDLLDIDPRNLEPVDILHASPPCTAFSTANKNSGETGIDLALSEKVCQFIEVLRPSIFTLENVWRYRESDSWKQIQHTLKSNGYWFDFAHINFADLGVPQNRKRMIVRAIKGRFVPRMPPKENWIGWYSAIQDLTPTLPTSRLSEWQAHSIPAQVAILESKPFILGVGTRSSIKFASQPVDTITSGRNQLCIKAWLPCGRIAKMTPRALARLQSFPDTYKLPEGKTLACKIVGNAVPPLGYQRIIEPLIEYHGNGSSQGRATETNR